MSEMNFSDEPLEITQQDFDDWEAPREFPAPPIAGTYNFYVSEIREEKEVDTANGKRYNAVFDLKVVGGPYDDRAITYVRKGNFEFKKRKSTDLLDMYKSFGVSSVPRSNKEYSTVLHALQNAGRGMIGKAGLDWEGFCGSCYEKALAAAGTSKEAATPEEKKAAGKTAMKAKNYRAFPTDAEGNKMDIFVCPDCGEEVKARVKLKNFIV